MLVCLYPTNARIQHPYFPLWLKSGNRKVRPTQSVGSPLCPPILAHTFFWDQQLPPAWTHAQGPVGRRAWLVDSSGPSARCHRPTACTAPRCHCAPRKLDRRRVVFSANKIKPNTDAKPTLKTNPNLTLTKPGPTPKHAPYCTQGLLSCSVNFALIKQKHTNVV